MPQAQETFCLIQFWTLLPKTYFLYLKLREFSPLHFRAPARLDEESAEAVGQGFRRGSPQRGRLHGRLLRLDRRGRPPPHRRRRALCRRLLRSQSFKEETTGGCSSIILESYLFSYLIYY